MLFQQKGVRTCDLYNLEEWLKTFVSLELTLSGLMLTASSFLIREYLAELRKVGVKKRDSLLFWLILSLVFVPIPLTAVNAFAIVSSDIQNFPKLVLLLTTLSPLIPISIILTILFKVET